MGLGFRHTIRTVSRSTSVAGKAVMYIIATIVALSFTGCVTQDELCDDMSAGNPQDTGMVIRFRLSADILPTRAVIDGADRGTDPERFLDVSSMEFLLFDNDRKFIQYFTPSFIQQGESYIAEAALTSPFWQSGNNATEKSFYIMAFANGRSMGSGWVSAQEGVTTIEDVCSSLQASVMTYLPDATSLLSAEFSEGKQLIPMAGIQKFTATMAELRASTAEHPLDLTLTNGRNLNLLRALAKIEVVDKANYIGQYDASLFGNRPERITTVRLSGFMNGGAQAPFYNNWFYGLGDEPQTQQIDSPSIPASSIYVTPPDFHEGITQVSLPGTYDLNFAYDAEATSRRSDKAPVYSAYVYEYSKASTSGQQPYIKVVTKGDATVSSVEIPFRLGQYEESGTSSQTTPYLSVLLRNHIYTYEVQNISLQKQIPLEITLNVADWTEHEMNVDYSDNLTIANTIDWVENSYQYIDRTAKYVVIRPSDSGNLRPLKCTFGFSTPLGATWIARFITLEGSQGAFAFLKDGMLTNEITGNINGTTLEELSIVPTSNTPLQNNRALLQILVRMANGTFAEANFFPDEGFTNYTIIQNKQ